MLANKAFINFGTYAADMSTAATVSATPAAMRPTIGPLAAINYKTATLHYFVENMGAAEGTVSLHAGANEIAAGTLSATGGKIPVDLAAVQGQTQLEIKVTVTAVGSADARITARLDIEQPIVSGC